MCYSVGGGIMVTLMMILYMFIAGVISFVTIATMEEDE